MMQHPHSKQQQRGVAWIEFSIFLIPMLLMLLALTEYGRAIYQYNTLVKSVRDATRYLTTVAPGNSNEWDKATWLVLYGQTTLPSNLDNVLVPGLNAPGVSIDICDASKCPGTHAVVPTGQGAVNLVTVEIRGFQFQSLFNFTIGGLTFGAPDITYGAIGNTMRQAL